MQGSPPGSFHTVSRSAAALWFLGAALLILTGWALGAMAPVAIPVVFAILITLLVAPLDNRLKSILPDALGWIAHLAVMVFILAILFLFGGALVFAAQQALDAIPNVSSQLNALMPGRSSNGDGVETQLVQDLREVWGNFGGMFGGWIVDQATSIATAAVGITGSFFSTLLIVFFIVLLALTELTQWRGKMHGLLGGADETAWQATLTSLTARLRRFLVVRTFVGILQAALYVGWLAIFGIDLLVVWAILAFVLTYIPSLGSVISGVLPVLYAFVVADPMTALAVAGGIFVIEQVVGNFIDPQLLGKQIVLSPMVILVSLLFWAWLWGIAGAFLATPITLCLLVVMHRIPPLRPLALFLSNQESLENLDEALRS